MKFYFRLALIVAILIGLLLWFKQGSVDSTTAPGPASEPASQSDSKQLAQAVATPVTHVTPTPATRQFQSASAAASRQRQMPAQSSGCAQLAPAAARARCQVASCQEQGGWVVITVWGYDRNNLNDFLDEAMRVGVRNVSPQQAYRQSMDAQGRPVF